MVYSKGVERSRVNHTPNPPAGPANSDIELYRSADGAVTLEVRADDETVWVSRLQLAKLFGRDVKTIGRHINNARREELADMAVVAEFATTASDGKTYQVEHYNLDMVLSIGYRVKSQEGVHFRRWANDVLKRYLLQGVSVNHHRLAQLGQAIQILTRPSDDMVAGVSGGCTGRPGTRRSVGEYYQHSLPGFRRPRALPHRRAQSRESALPHGERSPTQRWQ